MYRVRRSVFARSFLLPLALLIWLSACHKWVPLEPPIEQAIAEEKPGTVRVTLANANPIGLKEPRISGDSLVGVVEESYVERGKVRRSKRTVQIPLDSVQTIEERRTDTLATAGTVIGITIGAILVFWAVTCAYDPDQIGC
jgi:hypothetical protein